jgi:hypothetical protein
MQVGSLLPRYIDGFFPLSSIKLGDTPRVAAGVSMKFEDAI